MKLAPIVMSVVLTFFSFSAIADVSVQGYTRKDGTYVQPHHRSDPDGNSYNNWSTKGNVNPYTGQEGSRNPQNDQWNNNF